MPYASPSANFILYTPFDSKSVAQKDVTIKMTQKEFIKNCYVRPKFQKELKLEAVDENIESSDYLIDYESLIEQRNKQKNDYTNFLMWMNSHDNDKIYTISGNAGTGKTTFIRRLVFENTDKNWLLFDLTQSQDFIEWFNGYTTNIENFHIPCNKMISIVLERIKDLLLGDTNKNAELSIDRLSHVLDIYKRKYSNYHLSGNDFFEGLIKNIKKRRIIRKYVSELNKVANYLTTYFEQLFNRNKDVYLVFRKTLDIMVLLSCCLYRDKDQIIVFDNLERFIAHDEIYNSDLDMIRRKLAYYSNNINSKTQYYQCNFKFILGIRTSSNRMCGVKLHSADELPSDLNITDWFLIDDIIQSKLNWYKKNGATTLDVRIISQIICDLRECNKNELTGLQLIVYPLFNNNIRLLTDFIGQLVERITNSTFIEKYEQLWNEDTPVSRFAARSIIRGLIYQELDNNDNLFHHLKLYTEVERKQKDKNDDDYGMSYVRKILTILYNNKSDVSLEYLISSLCGVENGVQEYWNDFVPDKTKNNISEILFYMNSYNRRENDWIQFVDMQINGMKENTFISDPHALKDLISRNMHSIFLRIMPAGEAYLRYIVASFEFFSYRFYKNHNNKYVPLFATIPTITEINQCNDIKELYCYKILEYVKINALRCIENIEEKGDIKIYLSDSYIWTTHIRRIINHHQGFIDNFIFYIKQKYPNDLETNVKLQSLINACIQIKEEYQNRM